MTDALLNASLTVTPREKCHLTFASCIALMALCRVSHTEGFSLGVTAGDARGSEWRLAALRHHHMPLRYQKITVSHRRFEVAWLASAHIS